MTKIKGEEHLGRMNVGTAVVTAYSPELGLRICEHVASGQLIADLAGTDGMPTYQTIMRWGVLVPDFGDALRAAREMSAFALEEEAIGLGRDLVRSKPTAVQINAYKAAMEQLRWSTARRNPKVFSERGALTVTVPIQINTTLGLDERDEAPKVEQSVYTIEAQVQQLEEAQEDPNGFTGLALAHNPETHNPDPKPRHRSLQPPNVRPRTRGPRKRVLTPPGDRYKPGYGSRHRRYDK